ncbi:MAG: MscL family protein [Thermoplasmata archaeon]
MTVVEDLKTFLTQATFVTLAVAFVVGTQVSAVITALVSSIINPAIAVFFHANFTQVGLVTVNGSTFTLGALLGAVLNFVIVLVVVFFVVVYPFALYTKRQAAKAAAAPPTTKNCPFCYSSINIQATRCAFCTATVPLQPAPAAAVPAAK